MSRRWLFDISLLETVELSDEVLQTCFIIGTFCLLAGEVAVLEVNQAKMFCPYKRDSAS